MEGVEGVAGLGGGGLAEGVGGFRVPVVPGQAVAQAVQVGPGLFRVEGGGPVIGLQGLFDPAELEEDVSTAAAVEGIFRKEVDAAAVGVQRPFGLIEIQEDVGHAAVEDAGLLGLQADGPLVGRFGSVPLREG